MDKKASRGRKKEKFGLAKTSDMNGRQSNRKQKEAEEEEPVGRQGPVCEGTNMTEASNTCLNNGRPPHLDIGKREGSASVVQSEATEGSTQCTTGRDIHQSADTCHHGDETTKRSMDPESVSSTVDDAYPEQLTPEQLTSEQRRILLEKTELEELLEQTKRLQKQAEMCLHRKDENSLESENIGYACKQPKEMTANENGDLGTVAVIPHEQKAPQSNQEEPDGCLTQGNDEFSVPSENATFSLRDNIQLLEENTELLHKKIELKVLLQTANVLLEKTDLPEPNFNKEEDLSFTDTCNISFKRPDDPRKLEPGTTYNEEDSEQFENSSSVEILYDKADEITRKAKLFVDMLHEDMDSGSKKTQLDLENYKPLLQNSELASDKPDKLLSKCLEQEANPEEEEKASHVANKGLPNELANCTEGEPKVKDTKEVDDTETYDQKLELQRLLNQARGLLQKVSSPLWTDPDMKEMDKSLQEPEQLPRTTKKKALAGQMLSNLEQKGHVESQQPLEITIAKNKMPFGVKEEVSLEGVENNKQIQDSGAVGLQPVKVANSETQNGLSETVATDTNSWPEVQTALLCEKNELSLLLIQTQLLQQKAEMILTRNQLQTGSKKENILAPSLVKATQLSPHETTDVLHTAELASEITKQDLEMADICLNKLIQTSSTGDLSSVINNQVLDKTQTFSEAAKAIVETTGEKTKPHDAETQLSSETTKDLLDATPLSSETTKEVLHTSPLTPETTKAGLQTTLLSPQITKPTLETTEDSSEKIKPMSDITEICSQATNPVEQTTQTLSGQSIQVLDKTSAQDPKTNNGASQEESQSHDYEDSESNDEDDDPSFDAREELRLLLQRAKLLIEKSKLPVSQRQNSAQLEMCHPPELIQSSGQENESNESEQSTLNSNTAAQKLVELKTEENEGSYSKQEMPISKIMNKTDNSLRKTDDVQDEMQRSQDNELEFLLAKTKLMKLKADELLTQINFSDTESDQQLPNSELSNVNKVQLMKETDELRTQINVPEAERDSQSANIQLPSEDNEIVSRLTSCTTLSNAKRIEADSTDAEQLKQPTELNLHNLPTIEKNIYSNTTAPLEEICESVLTLNEDSQLELEDVEESQLEISENEKSQFEIEDEYLSDNSELSDMNMYYEDGEYSQDEDENLPKENEAMGNENHLPQSQQQAENAEKKESYEKRELELLIEITKLLLEKATLPLELIETIPDENNSTVLTESGSENANTFVSADHVDEELNLSLHDTIQVLETRQAYIQETETASESTETSSEKTGTVVETKEEYKQPSETVTESTATSSENTGTVAETTEEYKQKTERVTESTAMSSETTGVVIETTDVSLQNTGIVAETTKMTSEVTKPDLETIELPSEKSHSSVTTVEFLTEETSDSTHPNEARQPEGCQTAQKSNEQTCEDMTSSELSQKLQQLKTDVTSFLQSELRIKGENSSTVVNSLQDRVSEALAESSVIMSATDEPEAHSDHSSSTVVITGTRIEQKSQFHAKASEAKAGVPVSHMEAGIAADMDSVPFEGWTPMTSYTLLIKLQTEMAKMQLQLSNLQDAMRTTNCIIQQLMEEAFSKM